jgi:glycerol uptake facilitator-like aquaporin
MWLLAVSISMGVTASISGGHLNPAVSVSAISYIKTPKQTLFFRFNNVIEKKMLMI